MDEIITLCSAHPEAVAVAVPFVAQGVSWVVKKSPWLWDDTLWGWCKRNKAGLSYLGRMFIKKK